MALQEHCQKKAEKRSFQDYFHPIALMLPFIGGVTLMFWLISQPGKWLSWWHLMMLLCGTECWSFGWHLNQHHGENRQDEAALWRFLGVAIASATFMIKMFTQILEGHS